MSRDFNKVIVMGRLARDPDVRFTPNKQKVVRFTICTGRQWKNKSTGETQSHTDFINTTAWGGTADIIERYTKKGSQVLIEGRISTNDFDDPKTGQHRWVTEVVAENIVLLGSGRRDDEGSSEYSQRPQAPQGGYTRPASSEAVSTGDMGSLREEAGFEDEFPLDFSEMGGVEGPGDVQIPF